MLEALSRAYLEVTLMTQVGEVLGDEKMQRLCFGEILPC